MTPRQIADALRRQAEESQDLAGEFLKQPYAGHTFLLWRLADAFAEIADADEFMSRQISASIAKNFGDNTTNVKVAPLPPQTPARSCRTPDGGLWLSPECARKLFEILDKENDVELVCELNMGLFNEGFKCQPHS